MERFNDFSRDQLIKLIENLELKTNKLETNIKNLENEIDFLRANILRI